MGQGERDRERRVGERTRPARDGAGAGHTSTDAVRLGTAASEPLPTMGLTHLAPVARVPGGTGPQVAAAGGLGPASSSTVVLPARAAAHGPPDSAQAAGGGALRGPEAVSQWPAPAPALAASGLPTQGKHPCRVGNDLHQPCGRLRGREVPLCSLGPRAPGKEVWWLARPQRVPPTPRLGIRTEGAHFCSANRASWSEDKSFHVARTPVGPDRAGCSPEGWAR